MVTAEQKANQVLNEASEKYLQAMKDTQKMVAKLGLSRNDADLLEGLMIRMGKARQAYEEAQENSKA